MDMQSSAAIAIHNAQRASNRLDNRAANCGSKPRAWRAPRAVVRRERSKSERAKFGKKVRVREWMRGDLNELDAELAELAWCPY